LTIQIPTITSSYKTLNLDQPLEIAVNELTELTERVLDSPPRITKRQKTTIESIPSGTGKCETLKPSKKDLKTCLG